LLILPAASAEAASSARAVGSLTTHSIQAASVTCYNDSCTGLDPVATGCAADAYTLTSSYINEPLDPSLGFGDSQAIGQVDLRYSPTCGTKWIRETLLDQSYWNIQYWHMYLQATRPSDGLREIEYGNWAVAWTNMLAGIGRQVCGWGSLTDGSDTYTSSNYCV
jgi:Protein of unknown function (DUF2690)